MVQVNHNKDVNAVCNDLLQNGTASPYFVQLTDEPDWLEENGASSLKEARLFDLICTANRQHTLFPALLQFVEYAAPEAISDRVFSALMNLPAPFRNDVLVSLSHKQLSAAQLEVLCATNITFECYYCLASDQFQQAAYSAEDLRHTLHRFQCSKFGEQMPYLLAELSEQTPSSEEKRRIVEELVQPR